MSMCRVKLSPAQQDGQERHDTAPSCMQGHIYVLTLPLISLVLGFMADLRGSGIGNKFVIVP